LTAVVTLDEISEGRAVLGYGAGISAFAELGIRLHKRPGAIRESLELIRALLCRLSVDDHVSFEPIRSYIPVYVASDGSLGHPPRCGHHTDIFMTIPEPVHISH
jgi:5,10-methylenetetrahydromethanopterin reductase